MQNGFYLLPPRPARCLPEDARQTPLVALDSHIGYGSPKKQDTAAAHGGPSGEEDIRLVKRNYGCSEESRFLYLMGSMSTLQPAWVRAAGRPVQNGQSYSAPIETNIMNSQPKLI